MTSNDKIDLYKLHKDQYVNARSPVLVTLDEAVYLTISGRAPPAAGVHGEGRRPVRRGVHGQDDPQVRRLAGLRDRQARSPMVVRWRKLRLRDRAAASMELESDDPDATFRRAEGPGSRGRETPGEGQNPGVDQVKRESITEGLCVQMLHVGPYQEEGRSICAMKAFAEERGLTLHGHHHEIYLSDPRRVPPEKLKTILRLPVRKK